MSILRHIVILWTPYYRKMTAVASLVTILNVHADINHLKDIDELSTKVVQVCLQAADESIPSKARIEKEKVIPGWDRIDKPRKDALFWHAIWKSWVLLMLAL